MATRKKYRSKGPQGFYQGGAVPEPEPAASDAPARASMPVPVDDGSNPLGDALAAAKRADELQRQAADPKSAIERQIDKMEISGPKKEFLKRFPQLATDTFMAKSAGWHHQAALDAGVEDDTPEMFARVLDGAQREAESMHWMAKENVRAAAAPPAPAPEPEVQRPPPPAAVPPAPAPARRGMPMSAPVSRGVPSAGSGRREPSSADRTLSPEEREIARNSFTDPTMSNSQKEYLYLQNKLKLKRQRESGEYRQTTEQSG